VMYIVEPLDVKYLTTCCRMNVMLLIVVPCST